MSVRDLCILASLCMFHAWGAATATTHVPSASILTCPFRTINYLTHTLPQQCLPSGHDSAAVSYQINGSTITSPAASSITRSTQGSVQNSESRTTIELAPSPRQDSSTVAKSSTASLSTTSIESVTTIIPTSSPASVPIPLLPGSVDEDSPLESGNFLSFEDWKKQNLIKAGQSEHLGRNVRTEQRQPRKRPENVHNTLDSLGDDAEIDLDFSGIVPGNLDNVKTEKRESQNSDGQRLNDSDSGLQTRSRRKDAGTTGKERFNYASFDCAANVLKSNSESKNANLVLRENKDLYMLNKCSASNKFIILELCEDIYIDTVVLANFEYFSSSFRSVRVSVSDKYPVRIDKWKSLGIFEARNTREVQAFLVENPVMWARYVRIEFLTHYGTEFYCPVSLIRIHGITMMEEYKAGLETNVEEDEDEAEILETENVLEDQFVPEAVDVVLLTEQYESETASPQDDQAVKAAPRFSQACRTNTSEDTVGSANINCTSPNTMFAIRALLLNGHSTFCSIDRELFNETTQISDDVKSNLSASMSYSTRARNVSTTKSPTALTSINEGRASNSSPTSKAQPASVSTTQKTQHSTSAAKSSSDGKKSTSTVSEHIRMNSTNREPSRAQATKQSGSATQVQPASPTLQESFFKSVQKRLQMLESNSSLSLQYIEEQSRSLRDAFRKVEQRQFNKTSHFLEQLNSTVLKELREFRQQYDQLWQSTVIELAMQSERHQQESQAMNARLGVLADELIFQRRVSILQMILILVCLGLVLFSRGTLNNYLDLPLVQSVLSKSPGSRWINLAGDSRTASPATNRSRSAHQARSKQGILKRHIRAVSEDSNHEPLSASELYSPPTPVSFDGYSDAELVKGDIKMEDPEFDPINIQRPSTSPPVLPSIDDPATPRSISALDESSIESRMLSPIASLDTTRVPLVKTEFSSPAERHLTWDLPE